MAVMKPMWMPLKAYRFGLGAYPSLVHALTYNSDRLAERKFSDCEDLTY